MNDIEEIRKIIAGHEEELKEKFKVKRLGTFGSYARNEQRESSDLDLLIAFEDEKSIVGFEFIGCMMDLEEFLENTLGIKVHLATERQAIHSNKGEYVKKDLIYV
ncbi:MAG: nucleotidyltransferase family protein [Thermodesulfobacteriota bacterium]